MKNIIRAIIVLFVLSNYIFLFGETSGENEKSVIAERKIIRMTPDEKKEMLSALKGSKADKLKRLKEFRKKMIAISSNNMEKAKFVMDDELLDECLKMKEIREDKDISPVIWSIALNSNKIKLRENADIFFKSPDPQIIKAAIRVMNENRSNDTKKKLLNLLNKKPAREIVDVLIEELAIYNDADVNREINPYFQNITDLTQGIRRAYKEKNVNFLTGIMDPEIGFCVYLSTLGKECNISKKMTIEQAKQFFTGRDTGTGVSDFYDIKNIKDLSPVTVNLPSKIDKDGNVLIYLTNADYTSMDHHYMNNKALAGKPIIPVGFEWNGLIAERDNFSHGVFFLFTKIDKKWYLFGMKTNF